MTNVKFDAPTGRVSLEGGAKIKRTAEAVHSK